MRANIYIRKENEERWDRLADKSQWINDILSQSGKYTGGEFNAVHSEKKSAVSQAKVILEPKPGEPAVLTSRNRDLSFCKHNAVKGLCKKGCK